MTASSAPGDPSAADGPLVRVTLPDGQSLYAVASACRQERDGSWGYDLQVHLLAQAENGMNCICCNIGLCDDSTILADHRHARSAASGL